MNSKMYQPNISQSISPEELEGLTHQELVQRLSVLMTEQSKQKSGPSKLLNVRSHFNFIPRPSK